MSEDAAEYRTIKKYKVSRELSKLLYDENPTKEVTIEITKKEVEALKNVIDKINRAFQK